ncbi:cation diffusion facilitator family transporter [Massilia sp. S19_KUP03_FR1]|uniref:cation diffusion facilitator family transporter n=1 Tax=Massilia sp. S19_KUP03_FR1 TaxID=3025503 RepID=UPI002FCDDE54
MSAHDHSHHDHDHGHHGHSHGHHHALPTDHGRAFALAIGINSLFVVIEFVYGFIANSTALMADAGHNLSDVLGLALAWGAAILAKRAPNKNYTYGLRGSSIVAALLNALLLMLACGAIAWEAVQRFSAPPAVAGMTVSVVAAIGVAVNGFSAWLFMAGSKGDLNIRGAYQHMAADAAISLGVVISGIVIMYTGWAWLDPAVSLVIVAIIVVSTWSLLRESVQLVLAGVPPSIDSTEVSAFLGKQEGVSEVHDLHIWAMSTTETALTAHLVMPGGYPGDARVDAIGAKLRDDFKIAHCTLQVEEGTTDHGCALHPV